MSKWIRIGVLAFVALVAMATTFAADLTVGGFYTRLAQMKPIGVVDAADVEAKLRSEGFQLPALSLNKTLTEGDVAAIATALGVSVTTRAPATVVNVSQADAFLATYSNRLGAKVGTRTEPGIYSQGNDPGQSGNGKGKKKGHNKCTAEPV